MRYLRTNTAARVTVGAFFDASDGITPKTALTVTNCKLTMVVDNANIPTLVLDTNPTASGGSNDMIHISGDDAGFYDLELAAANVNYLGRAMLALTDASNHRPVIHEFTILPAAVYDAMILGTDLFDVNVQSINDSTNAAINQQAALDIMYQGSVTGAASTTTLIDSGLTYADNDHWKGRCAVFLTDSTIKHRATVITAYDAATKKLTFSAIGLTPAVGNTYIII